VTQAHERIFAQFADRSQSFRQGSRAPWRTWPPHGCWTRGGGSPNC
jgi:hypothetical protein